MKLNQKLILANPGSGANTQEINIGILLWSSKCFLSLLMFVWRNCHDQASPKLEVKRTVSLRSNKPAGPSSLHAWQAQHSALFLLLSLWLHLSRLELLLTQDHEPKQRAIQHEYLRTICLLRNIMYKSNCGIWSTRSEAKTRRNGGPGCNQLPCTKPLSDQLHKG